MKTILCLALLGLFASTTFAAVLTSSATASAFNSTPVKVFDSSNTTTGTTDGTFTATGGVTVSSVVFGAGATNDTIYVYAVKYASGTGILSTVLRRTINATQAALGTDTKEESVLGADATITITGAPTLRAAPVTATGNGTLAVAGVVAGSGKSTGAVETLTLWTLSGGSLSQTYTMTAAAPVSTSSTVGTIYSFAIGNVWHEDGAFYIIYEKLTVSCNNDIGANVCTPSGQKTTDIQVAGYTATVNGKVYTAPFSVASSLTIDGGTNYYQLATAVMGGMSNYTNSALIQVQYKDPTAASAKLYYGTYKRADGSASSAVAAYGTDATYASNSVDGVVYYPGGFINSNYTYGAFLGNITTPKGGASTVMNYGGAGALNGTTAAASLVALGIAATQTNGKISVMGTRFGTGFGVIIATPAGSSTNGYTMQAFFANGTANGTSSAFASCQNTPSSFIDVNGALWFGYYSYDSTNGPTTGYIGRLVGQVNTYNGTTKAANVLATFAAILTFVIASLFMF